MSSCISLHFSLPQYEGQSLFFLSRLLSHLIMLLLVFLSWPEEGERGKDRFRQGGARGLVIGLVDPEGLREFGELEGARNRGERGGMADSVEVLVFTFLFQFF